MLSAATISWRSRGNSCSVAVTVVMDNGEAGNVVRNRGSGGSQTTTNQNEAAVEAKTAVPAPMWMWMWWCRWRRQRQINGSGRLQLRPPWSLPAKNVVLWKKDGAKVPRRQPPPFVFCRVYHTSYLSLSKKITAYNVNTRRYAIWGWQWSMTEFVQSTFSYGFAI